MTSKYIHAQHFLSNIMTRTKCRPKKIKIFNPYPKHKRNDENDKFYEPHPCIQVVRVCNRHVC